MPLLEIKDLVKTYARPGGGEHRVVDVAAFSLEAGEQLALRGESGSGKTTFLNLIAGILAADSGSIGLDGHDVTALGEAGRDRLRAGTIGYIFQTFNLLQGHTVLENVELGMAFGGGVALDGQSYLFAGGYGPDAADTLAFDAVPKADYDTAVFQQAVAIFESLQLY